VRKGTVKSAENKINHQFSADFFTDPGSLSAQKGVTFAQKGVTFAQKGVSFVQKGATFENSRPWSNY
jgi:hypothetical protein